jgi:hypothetical protein
MRALILAALLIQPGPRPPLAPAETLIEPDILRAIEAQAPDPDASTTIAGTDAMAHILLTCRDYQCAAAERAARKLYALVSAKTLAQPLRSIRVVSTNNPATRARAMAAVHVAEVEGRPLQVIRGLWSTASIGDEVAELFARHRAPGVELKTYENLGQLQLDPYGIPTTTVVSNPTVSNDRAVFIAAATAYFLATLPNAGAEPLLSHLTVGAHARLAEDGRRAVAMMGNQQRAGADVLIFFGQAIEREQRRMRSFTHFMPTVDPMLRSRIADMEKSITAVWTSIGITSSPFVPAAERLRGRGGEDRRVPSRTGTERLRPIEPATAMLKFENVADILYELGNLVDGKRSISDIRDVLSAEFGPLSLPIVVDYFERLAKTGAVTLR